MSQPAFRTIQKQEIASVQAFVDKLYELYPGEPGAEANMELTFEHFHRHPDKGRVVVFDKSGCLVGYAILVFFWSNEFNGDIIEIDELFIEQEQRGSGIGNQFFSWIGQTYPNSAGLSLQVSKKNAGAAKLYEQIGFQLSQNNHMFKLKVREGARSLEHNYR